MAQRTGKKAAQMVVHDGTYRVVVLRNPDPAHADDAIHALCLEQSLGGRGKDVAAALADLAETMEDALVQEYEQSLPEYVPNVDPELERVFDRETDEFEGCPVLRRGRLRISLERTLAGKRMKLRPREFSFQPEFAVGAA
jgi:hypothetical protein